MEHRVQHKMAIDPLRVTYLDGSYRGNGVESTYSPKATDEALITETSGVLLWTS